MQATAPSFAAAVPAQPSATGAFSPSSAVAPNPYDMLAQQVELNSELLTYQALYNGIASDNLHINSAGKVDGVRRQVTMAFPINITPFQPYRGSVAEVRVFLLPTKKSSGRLSVVNLLPASNTYNVARATTNTKQFGAGVTLEAVGLGVNTGKTKSTIYLAKDTDTIALQYANPTAAQDKDLKAPFASSLRYLLPTGGCDITSNKKWTEAVAAAAEDYAPERALIFGWQFKPVLGNEDILPIQRLFFAQVALDDDTDAPAVFIETRWRTYDRKTGVVGAVFKDSCTWQPKGTVNALVYDPTITDVATQDAGGGVVRITAEGLFADPNLQVKVGTTQKAPDAIASDSKHFEVYLPASTLLAAPNLDIIGTDSTPRSLVIPANPAKKCGVDSVNAQAVPFSDGTALVSVNIEYQDDRDETSEMPLVLFGTDVYGLRDHPFLPPPIGTAIDPKHRHLQFIAKVDALKSTPSVVVKDVNWYQKPFSRRIQIDPSFTSIQPLIASPSGGAAGSLTKGFYRLSGSGFAGICGPDKSGVRSCLTLTSSSDTTKLLSLDDAHFKVLNDSDARLQLEKDTPTPLVFLWSGAATQSEWTIDTKAAAPASTTITADGSLKKGDSRSIIFSGTDFSSIATVSFEGTALSVLAKDAKSITVLVTTTVTTSTGTKDLIAVGSDGKPIILPVAVLAP